MTLSVRNSGPPGRVAAALAATAVTLGAAAGCGTSSQDKAKASVCDARASIQKEVDGLKSLPPTSAGLAQLSSSLTAIQSDIKTIADAQGDLSDTRREQVKSATQAFG